MTDLRFNYRKYISYMGDLRGAEMMQELRAIEARALKLHEEDQCKLRLQNTLIVKLEERINSFVQRDNSIFLCALALMVIPTWGLLLTILV